MKPYSELKPSGCCLLYTSGVGADASQDDGIRVCEHAVVGNSVNDGVEAFSADGSLLRRNA